MLLPLEEVEQFFRLHRSLMFFVNQRLKVIPKEVATPEAYSALPPEARIEVHKAFLEHLDLIDAFVAENPFGFDEEDLELIRSWKHLVAGKFVIFRYLKKHAIFLSMEEPPVAYGVLALADPFEDLIGPYLPMMVKTILLPFKDRIVYDGLMTGYNVTFGGGYRRSFKESYDQAKERLGIVTSLPITPESARKAEETPQSKKRSTRAGTTGGKSSALEAKRQAHDEIVGLTDAFCQEHLNAEYGALCRKLAGVLARKRPSPLTSGKPESWASGIVRTIGWVNFLSDPSQPDHMKMTDIDKAFGVSEATGSAKSMKIRDLLNVSRNDPEWMLRSRMDQNPMVWMIQVNGMIADARHMPREIQEEAFQRGLIPYIPADADEE